MKFHDTFLRQVKMLDTFCKRFWDLGAALKRHQFADKTTSHKTLQGVEEKTFGEIFRKGETKSGSSREGIAGELGEYVWFVKLHWKLVDLIC